MANPYYHHGRANQMQYARQSIGAQTDAFGNLMPTPHLGMDGRPIQEDKIVGTAGGKLVTQKDLDWAKTFKNSPTAQQIAGSPVQANQNPLPVQQGGAGGQLTDFTALPMGAGRVIPDEGKTPQKTTGLAQPAGPRAMVIDPKYVTPGASNVARLTVGTKSGEHYIGDETGDRTADFTAGGKYSSAPGQPVSMALNQAQQDALTQAYPNLKDPKHPDSVAFQTAYQNNFDPSKPMSPDDTVNLAHSLFQPKSTIGQVGSDKYGTAPGSPGYVSPVNASDFTAPSLMGAQVPVSFAGVNVGAAPIRPIAGAPNTAAGKAGAVVGSGVSSLWDGAKTLAQGTGDMLRSEAAQLGNSTIRPVYNAVAGAFGGKEMKPFKEGFSPAPTAPQLGERTPQEVADWKPSNDFTAPVTFPKFQPGGGGGGAQGSNAPAVAGPQQDDQNKLSLNRNFSFDNI